MAAVRHMAIGVRDLHAHLASCARGNENDDALACIVATWCGGGGALPDRLGLHAAEYDALWSHHFPGALVDAPPSRGDLDALRAGEIADLRRLMVQDRAGRTPSEVWMAGIVAAACLGGDHLWQDLGLWSRRDLSALMHANFPRLAARNDRDMKWKKFLYKQLCETEGIYVCRAPSCESCVDYANCFGPED